MRTLMPLGTLTKRRAAATAVLAIALAGSVRTAENTFAAAGQTVDDARVKMNAPAMSAAVVIDDRLAWSAGFGMADVENDVAATGQTAYRIASISKTFAAISVMQLVERGLVSLDDPIQKYMPEFPPKGDTTITLRHLLTHTSGIRHYNPGEFESKDAYTSIADAIRIFRNDPLLFTPGTKYSYSTYGYNLLQGVVEKASGITYEAYLREKIWGPSGMTATVLEHPLDLVKHRARQYRKAGGPAHVENAPYADLSIKWAGGGIVSTAEDLARYHIAIDSGKLLKPDSLETMYTAMQLPDGTSTGYGLGWNVFNDDKGRPWVAHSGGAVGGTTYLLRSPERRAAVVLLCNLENAPDLKGLAVKVADAAAVQTSHK